MRTSSGAIPNPSFRADFGAHQMIPKFTLGCVVGLPPYSTLYVMIGVILGRLKLAHPPPTAHRLLALSATYVLPATPA